MCAFTRFELNSKKQTGIPILDKYLVNIDFGTLILIKEDPYSYMHNYLLNTFISEGIHEKEDKLLIINKDNHFENKQYEVYGRSDTKPESKSTRMFIAWKYEDLKINVNESKYSLTSKIEYEKDSLLGTEVTISSILEKLKFATQTRVAIYSLFSPTYSPTNIIKDLYVIKKACRLQKHICMISIPSFLFPNTCFNQFFDVVISLDSNIFSGILPNYKAVLHIEKLTKPFEISENKYETFKFGMKFNKDKLQIEKIDIPPEDTFVTDKPCSSF